MSTTASLGMIHLWDMAMGFSKVDKYTFSESFIKAGAMLAIGECLYLPSVCSVLLHFVASE